jgi:type 1 glutamine amidotransferase/nicotinamidase-related amidase
MFMIEIQSAVQRGALRQNRRLTGLGISMLMGALSLLSGPVEAANNLLLPLRSRVETPPGSGSWRMIESPVRWDPARTAVVICDMWDRHWCAGATERVAEMAPRMNETVTAMRNLGALIIHCPSDTLKFYEGTPQRRLAQSAPKAPNRPQGWKSLDRTRETALPIDDSDGGCDCAPQCRQHGPWRRQIATIDILEGDALTDSDEAYNLMMARGVTNVMVMGVHLNMCVLGRPFAIRNMVLRGQNVVLVRDLTDTMYNSRRSPYVSHFVGTDLMTEHVEKHWCPSVTSDAVVGGEPFRFRADRRPRVVCLIGEDEYRTEETLPAFADAELRWRGLDVRTVLAEPDNKHRFPGIIEALRGADLLVVSVRRRALPQDQLDAIRTHLAEGRAVVGIRTASHAFAPRGEDAQLGAAWTSFDPDVLGGQYQGHHGDGPRVSLHPRVAAAHHPILTGIDFAGFTSVGSLYRSGPLRPTATALVEGTIDGQPPEPVAWIHAYGPKQARVFYTSLGHPEDFPSARFRRLLLNGILWALDRPIPPML